MGCISVRLGVPNTGDVAFTYPEIGNISVGANPTGWFDIDEMNTNPLVSTTKVGNVRLNIYLICKVGAGNFLRVKPSEPMWITVDQSITYEIRSNTEWRIE